ncbi:hypothetical protein [uncultured Corynebacterium sp.]|uniref:hypothetical protein n=1 Tax=uncultured Corynebacterium sp. TaxID=159447 RepID=UPI0025E2B9FD|nr:hypothetical protein [uncultured Corynebacterium sp.]
MKRLTHKTVCTSVIALAATLTLAGCSGGADDGDGESVVGVAATPAASPATGEAVGEVTTGDAVTGLARIGLGKDAADTDAVAVLGDGTLSTGTLREISAGSADTVTVDKSCDSVVSAPDGVVLTCGSTVSIRDADGKETRTLDIGSTVTAAAVVTDGTVAVTTEGSDKVTWYDAEGGKKHSEVTSATPSGMVPVGNERNTGDDGAAQWRVGVLDTGQSSVADIDMDKRQYNAALRVGQGLGDAAAAQAPDGVLVASDPRTDQALVYTFTDVIRHTQAVHTGPSPWAVLWDADRRLMWVSTTGDNQLTAYRLATGTPVAVGHVDTVADVRQIADAPDGDLLLIGQDGTRQLIPSADLPTGR